jgi:hypothetical protein
VIQGEFGPGMSERTNEKGRAIKAVLDARRVPFELFSQGNPARLRKFVFHAFQVDSVRMWNTAFQVVWNTAFQVNMEQFAYHLEQIA